MTATLDQQLADLCAIHGLDRIEIIASKGGRFDVYVARGGKCQSDRLFGSDLAAAFKDALIRLNEVDAVEDFAPMEVAA